MQFLGIDYGSKRIGVAASDETGSVAMPLHIVEAASPKKNAATIGTLATERRIETIVIGESKDFKGNDNTIMKDVRTFAEELQRIVPAIRIIFEPEFLTTHQAKHIQGDHAYIDASAAALILQSYLDRRNADKI